MGGTHALASTAALLVLGCGRLGFDLGDFGDPDLGGTLDGSTTIDAGAPRVVDGCAFISPMPSQFDLYDVDTDATGNAYLVLNVRTSIEVGGTTYTNAGFRNVIALSITRDCEVRWVRPFQHYYSGGGTIIAVGIQTIRALPDGSGGAVLTGDFIDTIDFGQGSRVANGGTSGDMFVAWIDSTGTVSSFIQIGSTSAEYAGRSAISASGEVTVAGKFFNTITVGGPKSSAGQGDVFVARYSAAQTLLDAFRVGGIGDDSVQAVAIDASGRAILTGSFTDASDLGTGPLPNAGMTDAYVARYTASGATELVVALGGPERDMGRYLAIGPGGEITAAGSFGQSMTFASWTLTARGSGDSYVARLDPSGLPQWLRHFSADAGEVTAVHATSNGSVLVSGWARGAHDLGLGEDTSLATFAYVVALAPDGSTQWISRMEASGSTIMRALAWTGNRTVIAGGWFYGALELAGTAYDTLDGRGAFVAWLE